MPGKSTSSRGHYKCKVNYDIKTEDHNVTLSMLQCGVGLYFNSVALRFTGLNIPLAVFPSYQLQIKIFTYYYTLPEVN